MHCFVSAAQARLARIAKRDDRADAIGDMLYTLSATGNRDDNSLKEAIELSANPSVKPVKQMDLLYALDIYASATEDAADQTYLAALQRFAAMEQRLKGGALVELYVNACSIIAWDDPFRERWLGFAQSVCTPSKLRAAKAEGAATQALILAMMPVAMTLNERRDGFAQSAGIALSWLRDAEKAAAKSRNGAEKDFVASIGVMMHTMNSLCLDAFDEPDAADDGVNGALKLLRRIERRTGISGRSASLRRQVVDSMRNIGRETEAKNMLRQMLVRVEADANGSRIAFPEQVAILLQAARLEHDEQLDREQACNPKGASEV